MSQSSSPGMAQSLRTNKNSLSTQQSQNVSQNKITTNTKNQNFIISGLKIIKSYLKRVIFQINQMKNGQVLSLKRLKFKEMPH